MDSCYPCLHDTISAAGSTECSACTVGTQANTAKTDCGEFNGNLLRGGRIGQENINLDKNLKDFWFRKSNVKKATIQNINANN